MQVMNGELEAPQHQDFLDFFENAPIGLHIVGSDGIIQRANRVELDLLGYADSPDEYISHHIAEFHADAAVIDDILDRLNSGKSLEEYPARLKHKNGTPVPVVIHSNPRNDGDQFLSTRCYTFPAPTSSSSEEMGSPRGKRWPQAGAVTTKATSEEDMQAEYGLLSDFFENAPVGLHIVAADGIIKWANRTELKSLGFEDHPQDYIGHHITEYHDSQPVIDDILSRLVEGIALSAYQAKLLQRDGSIYSVSIYSSPRFDEGSFVSTRCITVPRHHVKSREMVRFTWPRNEEHPRASKESPEKKGDSLTTALRYLAGRRRPEESLGFLAETSKVLASSIDCEITMPQVAQLMVPFLSDWCRVDLCGTGDGIENLATATLDGLTDRHQEINALLCQSESETPSEFDIRRVQEDGEARVWFDTTNTNSNDEEEQAEALLEIGITSAMLLPIQVREKTRGSIALLRCSGIGENFGPAELALAEELARRISCAIEITDLHRR